MISSSNILAGKLAGIHNLHIPPVEVKFNMYMPASLPAYFFRVRIFYIFECYGINVFLTDHD